MLNRASAAAGDLVQISRVVLEPEERAENLPADTRKVPLVMLVKGTALDAARLGEQVMVLTPTGRKVTGELVAVWPAHTHGFGDPIPELAQIGAELRALIAQDG
ncbi:MAG: 2-amino-4-oxopentanoate thiolase subunit OrtA [Firmicutes bacterium]|jgi:hypothetical protein|nr:2-amino-4-oxopentanoate thiolase subunit OrtA [Bacillota bacterium]